MKKKSTVVGLILERDGETTTAYPMSSEKLAKIKLSHPELTDVLDSCNCGEEYCIDGYIYICAEGPSGRCQLFGSDWQCNDGGG